MQYFRIRRLWRGGHVASCWIAILYEFLENQSSSATVQDGSLVCKGPLHLRIEVTANQRQYLNLSEHGMSHLLQMFGTVFPHWLHHR